MGDVYVALYDNIPEKKDDLAFSKGDVVKIKKKTDPGWWVGECHGKVGWLPSNYVKLHETSKEVSTTTTASKANGPPPKPKTLPTSTKTSNAKTPSPAPLQTMRRVKGPSNRRLPTRTRKSNNREDVGRVLVASSKPSRPAKPPVTTSVEDGAKAIAKPSNPFANLAPDSIRSEVQNLTKEAARTKEGFLEKKGTGLRHNWKQRWFVLSDGRVLRYYEPPTAKGLGRPKGEIMVKDAKIAEEPMDGPFFRFMITHSAGELKMRTTSLDDKDNWIQVLRNAASVDMEAEEKLKTEESKAESAAGHGNASPAVEVKDHDASKEDSKEEDSRLQDAGEKDDHGLGSDTVPRAEDNEEATGKKDTGGPSGRKTTPKHTRKRPPPQLKDKIEDVDTLKKRVAELAKQLQEAQTSLEAHTKGDVGTVPGLLVKLDALLMDTDYANFSPPQSDLDILDGIPSDCVLAGLDISPEKLATLTSTDSDEKSDRAQSFSGLQEVVEALPKKPAALPVRDCIMNALDKCNKLASDVGVNHVREQLMVALCCGGMLQSVEALISTTGFGELLNGDVEKSMEETRIKRAAQLEKLKECRAAQDVEGTARCAAAVKDLDSLLFKLNAEKQKRLAEEWNAHLKLESLLPSMDERAAKLEKLATSYSDLHLKLKQDGETMASNSKRIAEKFRTVVERTLSTDGKLQERIVEIDGEVADIDHEIEVLLEKKKVLLREKKSKEVIRSAVPGYTKRCRQEHEALEDTEKKRQEFLENSMASCLANVTAAKALMDVTGDVRSNLQKIFEERREEHGNDKLAVLQEHYDLYRVAYNNLLEMLQKTEKGLEMYKKAETRAKEDIEAALNMNDFEEATALKEALKRKQASIAKCDDEKKNIMEQLDSLEKDVSLTLEELQKLEFSLETTDRLSQRMPLSKC